MLVGSIRLSVPVLGASLQTFYFDAALITPSGVYFRQLFVFLLRRLHQNNTTAGWMCFMVRLLGRRLAFWG